MKKIYVFLIAFLFQPVFCQEKSQNLFLETFLKKEVIGKTEPAKISNIFKLENATVNVVQVNVLVKPHYHEKSDEILYFVKGNGVLKVGDAKINVKPGLLVSLLKGTVHSYVNEGKEATVVLSIFAPAFDPKDRVFIEK